MAFDTKRGRVLQWLDKLAEGNARYCKPLTSHPRSILTLYGRLYATNAIILAEVQYPEFEHISDYGWMKVDSFFDDNGYYLEFPTLAEPDYVYHDKYLSDMFIDKIVPTVDFKFDVRVMKDALKPFEIYGIKPNMVISDSKCELTGHNKDVSMRVMMMGVR